MAASLRTEAGKGHPAKVVNPRAVEQVPVAFGEIKATSVRGGGIGTERATVSTEGVANRLV
jgi:hypothetical protein